MSACSEFRLQPLIGQIITWASRASPQRRFDKLLPVPHLLKIKMATCSIEMIEENEGKMIYIVDNQPLIQIFRYITFFVNMRSMLLTALECELNVSLNKLLVEACLKVDSLQSL